MADDQVGLPLGEALRADGARKEVQARLPREVEIEVDAGDAARRRDALGEGGGLAQQVGGLSGQVGIGHRVDRLLVPLPEGGLEQDGQLGRSHGDGGGRLVRLGGGFVDRLEQPVGKDRDGEPRADRQRQ